MNSLDTHYQGLLLDIMHNGVEKNTRIGKTKSKFGYQIRHKMKEGFPLLTTKKMYWKGIVTELIWFLRGDTNIKFLIDNGCHIWDGDAYKNYFIEKSNERGPFGISGLILTQEEFINEIKTDAEFAKKWGELGPIYGSQWRHWGDSELDQIGILIDDLKKNPDSRRLMVTAWNPEDLHSMTLPPCHYGFQVYTRELSNYERNKIANLSTHDYLSDKILDEHNIPSRAVSLMWNQRSVDVPLGLPFNVASYGLLLEILAQMTNMVADELIGNLGDCHIYENQLEGCRQQIPRESFALPKLRINTEFWATSNDVAVYTLDTEIFSMLIEDFQIEGYESHPAIKFPLSN
jgi:thymidylate synthase